MISRSGFAARLLWAALGATLLLPGCRPRAGSRASPAVRQPDPGVAFVDVTDGAGIRFVHDNGRFGRKWMPETTGAGCAFLDFDGDGWQDLLFVNSGRFLGKDPGHETSTANSRIALYRNNRDGRFEDVTERAGLRVDQYGQGVCVGDYDNDGFEDLYVTCLGPNFLFHNNGDGTFRDVTQPARVAGDAGERQPAMEVELGLRLVRLRPGWVAGPVRGELRRVVSGNRRLLRPEGGSEGLLRADRLQATAEHAVPEQPGRHLYGRERGDPIGRVPREGVGAVAWDYNGDGWLDLAVTNDTEPNFLFVNHEGRSVTEEAVVAGMALSESGHPKAGMGIDVADWNNDGRFSLLIGNFSNEKLSLFRDEGSGLLRDVADETGVGETSLPFLTFGLFFFDFDLDGWQDIFAANGHIQELVQQMDARITFRERPLLYLNQRNGRFAEVGTAAGAPLQGQYVLRGCASGDYDNDGDPDILVLENDGRGRLWRNDGGNRSHWIRFRLVGTRSNRSGVGAEITVRAGGRSQRQWVKSGGSFLSQGDLRATFGLGEAGRIDEVSIRWPGGSRESYRDLPGGQEYVITEGRGVSAGSR